MNIIIDKIIELLEVDVKTQRSFKKIYWGDPIRIPAGNLPAITVTPLSTVIENSESARDEDVYDIAIGVILDGRDFIGKSDTKTEAFEDLIKKVEERDVNNNILADTVLSVVNKTEHVDGVRNVGDISVQYGFKTREDGVFTVEAVISFKVYSNDYDRNCV